MTRQTVLNVFLSESSLRTQKFDDHLTVHCLVFYDLAGILSWDDSLRLRSRCDRAGITRYSICSILRTCSANSFDVLLDALFQHLTHLLRLVPVRISPDSKISRNSLLKRSLGISKSVLAHAPSSFSVKTNLPPVNTFLWRLATTLPLSFTLPTNC